MLCATQALGLWDPAKVHLALYALLYETIGRDNLEIWSHCCQYANNAQFCLTPRKQ